LSRREQRGGKKSKRKECGKKEETGNFSSINPCKMETMLGGGGGGGGGGE
jgi:hypothetical protein